MAGNQRNIFDVLAILVTTGMPVLATLVGVFFGKWLEARDERKRLKREVYLKANRALSRYADFYLGVAAYPDAKKQSIMGSGLELSLFL